MKQNINEIKRMQQLAGIKSNSDEILDFTKNWKSILLPFYKEVIKKIGRPDMSLNIYSRWIGDFIKNANSYTSLDALIDVEFKRRKPKTNEDLKNQLISFINFHM